MLFTAAASWRPPILNCSTLLTRIILVALTTAQGCTPFGVPGSGLVGVVPVEAGSFGSGLFSGSGGCFGSSGGSTGGSPPVGSAGGSPAGSAGGSSGGSAGGSPNGSGSGSGAGLGGVG